MDLVLRGARLVDGTGTPARAADVGIDDGRIAAVAAPGALPAGTGRADVIELDGLVLAPGFVDIHTHYDAQVLWDRDLTPSCWHGVTSVVMGNCGFGIAPTRPEHRSTIARTLENVEGMSVDALEAGIKSIKEKRGLDLIVIDSLEALEVLAKFKDRRREMYRLFEWLRDLAVTSFVVTERPDWLIAGHVLQGRWDEDFLADGVIQLRIHMVSDLEAQRRLRVVKMRGTKHETGYLAMVLDDGRFRVTRAMST